MFRERPHPAMRGIDPLHRPRMNDIVVYNMKKYKVTQCGLKYLHIESLDTKQVLAVRLQEVVKWFPTQEPPLLENMK